MIFFFWFVWYESLHGLCTPMVAGGTCRTPKSMIGYFSGFGVPYGTAYLMVWLFAQYLSLNFDYVQWTKTLKRIIPSDQFMIVLGFSVNTNVFSSTPCGARNNPDFPTFINQGHFSEMASRNVRLYNTFQRGWETNIVSMWELVVESHKTRPVMVGMLNTIPADITEEWALVGRGFITNVIQSMDLSYWVDYKMVRL